MRALGVLPRVFLRLDPLVLGSSMALVALGTLLIRAATTEPQPGLPQDLHVGQLRWVGLWFLACLPLLFIPYPRIIRQAPLLYGGALALLVLVRLIGPNINGAQRWLAFGGFRVQPSELMKIATVVLLARMLRFGRVLDAARSWFGPFLFAVVPMALVVIQPDLGTALLFIPVAVAVVLVSGIPLRSLALLALLGILIVGGAWNLLLKDYQKQRILSTYRHEQLTAVQRSEEGFQLSQALLAVGNGGWFGHGHREGPRVQSGKLPHRHNDFIFAVLAEEHGLFGAGVLAVLTGLLVTGIFRVAHGTRDPAGRLLCVGVGTFIGAQALVHVAVNVGLAPTTGMPFPLVSYGGSSLLSTFMGLTLVQNVALHRPPVPIRALRRDDSFFL